MSVLLSLPAETVPSPQWEVYEEDRATTEGRPVHVFVARRGSYEVIAADATLLGKSMTEWDQGGGLTGEAAGP